ncbi:hypothetical protein MTO96_021001 [Rhipicephalus appendiculatus]
MSAAVRKALTGQHASPRKPRAQTGNNGGGDERARRALYFNEESDRQSLRATAGAPAKSTLEQKKKEKDVARVCLMEGRVYKGAIRTLPTCQARVPPSHDCFRYAFPQTRRAVAGCKKKRGQPERGDATGKIPRERAKAPLTHIAENRNRRQNAEVHDLHMMSAEAPPPPQHVCAQRCRC